jgi:hypothetical protein
MENRKIKIAAIDGTTETSHSNGCNRTQPPKIKNIQQLIKTVFFPRVYRSFTWVPLVTANIYAVFHFLLHSTKNMSSDRCKTADDLLRIPPEIKTQRCQTRRAWGRIASPWLLGHTTCATKINCFKTALRSADSTNDARYWYIRHLYLSLRITS